jgi:hypothetical protein
VETSNPTSRDSKKHSTGFLAHFVCNMDEMGHQKSADRQEKACYVPASHPHPHVHFPVPRTRKRITLRACIVIHRTTDDTDLAFTGLTSTKSVRRKESLFARYHCTARIKSIRLLYPHSASRGGILHASIKWRPLISKAVISLRSSVASCRPLPHGTSLVRF